MSSIVPRYVHPTVVFVVVQPPFSKVEVDDIASIITLCLRHRLRKDPLETIDSGDKVSKIFNEVFEIED